MRSAVGGFPWLQVRARHMVLEPAVELSGAGSASLLGRICLLALRMRPILATPTEQCRDVQLQFVTTPSLPLYMLATLFVPQICVAQALCAQIIVVFCHRKFRMCLPNFLLTATSSNRRQIREKYGPGHISMQMFGQVSEGYIKIPRSAAVNIETSLAHLGT